MYYDRTCGTLLVTRCAWLERSRVSFSSSRRCAFAFSRLRFQGVRHDPVSESLRVLRRGLARRFMTRHHRLSRRRTPPRSRLHLRFESDSRATAVAPNVPRTVPQRAIGRARDRDVVRVDVRSAEDASGGGRRPCGRSGLRRSGVRSIARRSGLRRSASGSSAARASAARASGEAAPPRPLGAPADLGRLDRVGDGSRSRFPRGSAGALVSRRGPRRRRRTNAGPTLRGGRTWPSPARADSPGR